MRDSGVLRNNRTVYSRDIDEIKIYRQTEARIDESEERRPIIMNFISIQRLPLTSIDFNGFFHRTPRYSFCRRTRPIITSERQLTVRRSYGGT